MIRPHGSAIVAARSVILRVQHDSLHPFGLDRRLGRREARDGDAERRAAHIGHAGGVAELDGGRVAALLAADADLEVRAPGMVYSKNIQDFSRVDRKAVSRLRCCLPEARDLRHVPMNERLLHPPRTIPLSLLQVGQPA